MANVDYVEIAGASLSAVESELQQVQLPGPAQLNVDYEADDEYPVLIGVWSSEGPAVQRSSARALFDALAARTTWALRFTSDNAPGVIDRRASLAHRA